MVKKAIKIKIIYILIFTFFFSSVFMPLVEAAPRNRGQPKINVPRKTVKRLPKGYRDVWIGRNRYFQHNGIFYRRGPSGFMVVDPPIGVVVLSLPLGAVSLLIGGITFYLCGGIYYRNIPGGFQVVKCPEKPVVKEIYPVVPSHQNVGETVSVTVPLLNVRSGPGKNFPVIFQVDEGELLVVYGYAPDWLYVKYQDNAFGWVMLRYTSFLSLARG